MVLLLQKRLDMKKIILLSAIALSSLIYTSANAQFRLNVNINLGAQPDWGPAGYDYAEYYYLPDIDAYYYIPAKQFIYLDGRNWIFANRLPGRFQNYDLYRSYKVVVNEPRPYLNNRFYQSRYGQYRDFHNQRVIRDNRTMNRPDNWGRENNNYNSRPGYGQPQRDMPQRGYDHNDRNNRGRFGR